VPKRDGTCLNTHNTHPRGEFAVNSSRLNRDGGDLAEQEKTTPNQNAFKKKKKIKKKDFGGKGSSQKKNRPDHFILGPTTKKKGALKKSIPTLGRGLEGCQLMAVGGEGGRKGSFKGKGVSEFNQRPSWKKEGGKGKRSFWGEWKWGIVHAPEKKDLRLASGNGRGKKKL